MPFKYYFESIYKVKYLQAHWIQHRLVEGSFFLLLYYFFKSIGIIVPNFIN